METERLWRTRGQAVGYEALPGPPGWARQAACAGKAGPEHDPWHPPPEAPPSVRRALVAEAVTVCMACPVQVACGRYGIELLAADSVVAVYGGMSPDVLRDMARRVGRATRKTARHGTRSCYVKGCRRPECRAASTRYERARRLKGSQRRACAALTGSGGLCGTPVRDGSIFCGEHAIPRDSSDRTDSPAL
jgi:hypothetical protein